MEWPQKGFDSLQRFLKDEALHFAQCPSVVMTSSFSGVGTAEIAGHMGHQAFCQGVGSAAKFCSYSCCDVDKHCQRLLSFQDHMRVFGSTTELFEDSVLSKLRAKIKAVKIKVRNDGYPLKHAGIEVCHFAFDLFKDQRPKTTSFCYRCNSHCQRYPDDAFLSSTNSIWIDVSGSPCIPWTPAAYGNTEKWLHSSVTEAYMCWIFSLVNQGSRPPDVIVHENVSGFDYEGSYVFLQDLYTMESFIISPEDVGLPVARPRRYTLFVLNRHNLMLSFCKETWERLFFAFAKMDASLFLQATKQQIQDDFHAQVQSRRHLSDVDKDSITLNDLLTEKELAVVSQMRLKVLNIPPSSRPVAWFVNLSQSLAFQPGIRQRLHSPTLMTSSRLFLDCLEDPVMSRHIHPLELFAMQCLPIFMEGPGQSSFEKNVKQAAIPRGHQIRMAGNGMNCMVIGQVLLFCMGSVAWSESSGSRKRKLSDTNV